VMTWSTLLVVAVVVAVASAAEDSTPQAFARWAVKHNKRYASEEEAQLRFANWQATIARIEEQRVQYPQTRWALNHLSDLSPAEFRAKYLNLNPKKLAASMPSIPVAPRPAVIDPPAHFDWRDKKAVTYVKDQEQCGSCWAFSVVETIESFWFLRNNTLPSLSPQQIVSCDQMDEGCDGGMTDTAFQYVAEYGLMSEKDFPYRAVDGNCKYDQSKVVAKVKNVTYAIPTCNDTCKHQDEVLLKQMLVNNGPLSILVDATDDWQNYDGGPFMGLCSSRFDELDHAVQLVGYYGNSTWYVRNSWGSGWGQSGYIELSMGWNACGLADWVTMPTF